MHRWKIIKEAGLGLVLLSATRGRCCHAASAVLRFLRPAQ